ncbi:hypothetical protein COLO4_05597 [Corchorus olitorius]|uniref:Pentatricopeptide repeat-containing protein n=1 Tax=Corchorus olitorius TaxID=93759 RepID=A0A1R3KQG2_9ROSI|nr:hypothetical protein COLO4_05597 [Corchorus olitorius]
MTQDYGIVPTEEHYACMVDLLGRAGKIDEAFSFIQNMPIKPGASVWGALLSACRIHRRVELAEKVVKKLLPLEANKASVYVLLSNIYADSGRWKLVNKLRKKFGDKGLHKCAGFTTIEIGKKLHIFGIEDALNYTNTEVEQMWSSLREGMRELGYVPDISFDLNDVGR